MKRTLLFLALAWAGVATAADTPAARADAAPAPAARASAAAEVTAAAAARPAAAPELSGADADSARRELDAMRDQMRDLGRKMADLSARLGDAGPRAYAYRYMGDPDRAMLGIVMWPDDKGVKIAGLTPGGPAEKAGVKNGDVIVAIDGKPLTPAGKEERGGRAVGEATRAFERLKVGQEVKLAVLRDGKSRDITVKAERREALGWNRVMVPDDDGHGNVLVDVERIRRDVESHRPEIERAARLAGRHAGEAAQRAIREVRMRMPWWGLNLVPLDKDLAGYFGADQGVLVLRPDSDTFPDLKSGDVLLAIGDAKVEQPEQVMRLLRDAAPGSDVKLKLLRQKKTLTLSMKSPEFKAMFPLPPAPPEPPAPPTAPIPPEPPAPPAVHPRALPHAGDPIAVIIGDGMPAHEFQLESDEHGNVLFLRGEADDPDDLPEH